MKPPRIRALYALGLLSAVLLGGITVGVFGGGRTLTLLAVAAMHLCKPFQALSLVARATGIAETADIPYAAGARHGLDVYSPGQAGAAVVVFFYGGGWATGDKATYRFVGASLAERGVVVVIPDYRLHPAVRFPAFEQDAAAAVAWARANAARFGGDPRRLFLMGHSAGAQIATLLALDPQYLQAEGLSQHDICGVIGLAGVYDVLPPTRQMRAIFGRRTTWARWQPVNHVSPEAPPMLLLAGLEDGTVDPGNTLRLAERLRAGGGLARSQLYPGISHTAILASIADSMTFLAPTADATLDFIRRNGACGKAVAGAAAP